MARKPSPTVTQIKTIARLRAAGYPLSVVAARTRLSVATVARYCARLEIRKASFKSAIVEQAKRELAEDSAFVERVKGDVRLLVLDGLAQSRALRDKIALAIEGIGEPDGLEAAAVALRAAAAAATALRVNADMLGGIGIEADAAAERTVLTVSVMTPEQIGKAIRENHHGEEEEEGGL